MNVCRIPFPDGLRRLVLAVPAIAIACALQFAHAGPPAAARLQPAQSRIAFVTKQMGVPVEGSFGHFEADIAFDPRQPDGGSVVLQIDMASASLGVAQSDAELPRPQWFDSTRFPRASFRSTAIKALGAGQFEVAGRLTLKGHVEDVLVPVQITQSGGNSVATGSFTVRRLAFKVGDGEWTDTSVVANDVQVRFKLVLDGLGPL